MKKKDQQKGIKVLIGLIVIGFLLNHFGIIQLGYTSPSYRCIVGEQQQSCCEYCTSIGEECLASCGFARWDVDNGTELGMSSLDGPGSLDPWPRDEECSEKREFEPGLCSNNRPCCVCGDPTEEVCFLDTFGGDEGEYRIMVGLAVYDARTRNTEYQEVDMSLCIGGTTTTTILGQTTTTIPGQTTTTTYPTTTTTLGECTKDETPIAGQCVKTEHLVIIGLLSLFVIGGWYYYKKS